MMAKNFTKLGKRCKPTDSRNLANSKQDNPKQSTPKHATHKPEKLKLKILKTVKNKLHHRGEKIE